MPKYATIWITQYVNPQTDGCRKFRNPLLKPDCHLLYKHDRRPYHRLYPVHNWQPIKSVFVSSYPKPRNGFQRHLQLPVCIACTECSLTPRVTDRTGPHKMATLQSVAANPTKQHNTQVRHSEETFQCYKYLTNKHKDS